MSHSLIPSSTCSHNKLRARAKSWEYLCTAAWRMAVLLNWKLAPRNMVFHFTQASVVTLNTGFTTFSGSISRMFALSLLHERAGDKLQVSFAPELVLAKIQSDFDLREYWKKFSVITRLGQVLSPSFIAWCHSHLPRLSNLVLFRLCRNGCIDPFCGWAAGTCA
jgi:hypothetical protein